MIYNHNFNILSYVVVLWSVNSVNKCSDADMQWLQTLIIKIK